MHPQLSDKVDSRQDRPLPCSEMTGLDMSVPGITDIEIDGARMPYTEAYRLMTLGKITIDAESARQCKRIDAYLQKKYGSKYYLTREQFAFETGLDKTQIDSVNRLVNGRSKKYRDMFPLETCAEIIVLGRL